MRVQLWSVPKGWVAVLALASAAGLWGQDPLRGWHGEASTTALALAAVDEAPLYQTLWIKNVSDQTITALAVSSSAEGGNRRIDYIDYFDGDTTGLPPGQAYPLKIAAQDILRYRDKALYLEAAVFDGGRGDGVQSRLAFIDFKRLGCTFETQRVARILRTVTAANLGDGALATLAASFSELPNSIGSADSSLDGVRVPGVSMVEVRAADKDLQTAFLEGLRNTREGVLFKLNSIRAIPFAPDGGRGRYEALLRLQLVFERNESRFGAFVANRKGAQQQLPQ